MHRVWIHTPTKWYTGCESMVEGKVSMVEVRYCRVDIVSCILFQLVLLHRTEQRNLVGLRCADNHGQGCQIIKHCRSSETKQGMRIKKSPVANQLPRTHRALHILHVTPLSYVPHQQMLRGSERSHALQGVKAAIGVTVQHGPIY